jgi:hypothetical protein
LNQNYSKETAKDREGDFMTLITATGHRGLSLTAFAFAFVAFWALTSPKRSVQNDEFQIHLEELKQSAARNKQQLAHLFLTCQNKDSQRWR